MAEAIRIDIPLAVGENRMFKSERFFVTVLAMAMKVPAMFARSAATGGDHPLAPKATGVRGRAEARPLHHPQAEAPR